MIRFPSFLIPAAVGFALLVAAPATAQVSIFTDASTFDGATLSSIEATFESALTEQNLTGYSEGALEFTAINPVSGPLWVSAAGSPSSGNFDATITSNVLTGNGADQLFFAFIISGSGATAIGFDVYTNRYAAPTIRLYDSGGSLLYDDALTQSASSFGFFGATSIAPIARVDFIAYGGEVRNAGIDNVRIGAARTVPEPATLFLLGTGLFGIAFVTRRRSGLSGS